MTKVIVIDNYLLMREGLCLLIEKFGVQVIGSAAQEKGVELALSLKPDVVIVSINFRHIFDLEAAIQLLSKQNKVLVLSPMHDFFSPKLLDAGAFSYLTADVSGEELSQAIKETAANQHVIRYQSDSDRSQLPDFPVRDIEIIQGMLLGMSIKKIAEKLNLLEETVRSYRTRILQRLNVKNEENLAVWALKKKIVTLEDIDVD